MRPAYRFTCAALVALAAAQASPPVGRAQAAQGVWSALGPYGAVVNTIAINPVDPATVYVGTRNGLFKSTDGGARWVAASAGLKAVWVSEIAVDPVEPAILFAATTERLYRSQDAGGTWKPLAVQSKSMPDSFFTEVKIAPSDRSRIYARSSEGLLRSDDAGDSWELVLPQGAGIAIDPSDPDTVYASTATGLQKSADGGATWSPIADEVPWGGPVVDPDDPDTLYYARSDVKRTTDGGETWETLPAPWGTYITDVALATVPTLYAAGRRNVGGGFVARSDDGGESWAAVTRIPGDLLAPALGVLPGHHTVFAGSSGRGVFRSADDGLTFGESNHGLAGATAESIAFDPLDARRIFVSLGLGGVFRSDDAGATWQRIESGFAPPDADAFAGDVTLGAGSTAYAGRIGSSGGVPLTPVLRSDDGGKHWEDASADLPREYLRELYADPIVPGTAFAGFEFALWPERTGDLFMTTDGGETWESISPSPGVVAALAFRPSARAIAAAFHRHVESFRDEVFVSRDWGATWTPVTPPEHTVGSLAFGRTANILYAGSGWHESYSVVSRSDDGGATWTAARLDERRAGDEVHAIAVDPADPDLVYAGTRRLGLWMSPDGGRTWSGFDPDLLGVEVRAVVFPPSVPAATGLPRLTAGAAAGANRPAYAGIGGAARGGVLRVVARPYNVRRPAIAGKARPRRTLTCRPGRWSRATAYRYQWLRNGVRMRLQTRAKLRVRPKHVRARLNCRVEAIGPGGRTTALSKAVRVRKR